MLPVPLFEIPILYIVDRCHLMSLFIVTAKELAQQRRSRLDSLWRGTRSVIPSSVDHPLFIQHYPIHSQYAWFCRIGCKKPLCCRQLQCGSFWPRSKDRRKHWQLSTNLMIVTLPWHIGYETTPHRLGVLIFQCSYSQIAYSKCSSTVAWLLDNFHFIFNNKHFFVAVTSTWLSFQFRNGL